MQGQEMSGQGSAVIVCFALVMLNFFTLNFFSVIACIGIAAGFYAFALGFHLLARKHALLITPASKIRSAALGFIAVNGRASGRRTIPAPISGNPCFLHRTTAWRQRNRNRREWEKVAEENLHLPFFIDDSTGQLLIEPFFAELDLRRTFREEYDQPFLSAGVETNPPHVSAFLSRHGIASGSRVRIEEFAIQPDDIIFVAGTLAENPGIEVPEPANPSSNTQPVTGPVAPQIIRLAAAASASGGTQTGQQPMGQQAKIAAALARAGITNPSAWSAAGISNPSTTSAETTTPSTLSTDFEVREPAPATRLKLKPPVVLIKGTNNSTFLISCRSREEFIAALAWKCSAMIAGGAAVALLGFYMLMTQRFPL